jgi:hypothetical protein
MSTTAKKSAAKKSNGKKAAAARKASTPRKPTAIHMKLIALMTRKDGATIQDVSKTGFKGPTKAAMRIVENQGFKTSVVKKAGELSRYVAKKA